MNTQLPLTYLNEPVDPRHLYLSTRQGSNIWAHLPQILQAWRHGNPEDAMPETLGVLSAKRHLNQGIAAIKSIF